MVKRLESDRSPKIRTNVVIFYGRLAPDLPDNLRTKHALPAFVKALEDKVPFVRMAAVRALGACRDEFAPVYAARLVAPKLVPLALDPAKPVRDAAVPCLEAYLAVVRKAAEEMTRQEELRAKQEAAKRQAETPQKAPQQQAPPPTTEAGGTTTTARTDVAVGGLGLRLVGRRGRVQRAGQSRVGGVGSGGRPGVGRGRHGGGATTTTAQELHRRRRRRRLGRRRRVGRRADEKVEPKKASPKKPAARKVSPRKAPPPKDDFFDSWGDDQPAKPSRVAAAAR